MKENSQVVLPLNLGIVLPKDDPVQLLNEILEELDYTALIKEYARHWRKYHPVTLFKILVYAYMNGVYSSREIERECQRNICYMWLLNGQAAPDYSTIARFQNERLVPVIEGLFYQVIEKLHSLKEVNYHNLFVDGTKIEAYANKYSFVWKKSIEKNMAKLNEKIEKELERIKGRYCLNPLLTLQEVEEQLERIIQIESIELVQGKGRHKTQIQKDLELIREYKEKTEKYIGYMGKLAGRNSLSKTDTDATFMRMKEDYMRNGQLKPAYNIQIGVESEYIVGIKSFTDRDDVNTLKPFLENIRKNTGKKYRNIIADAGYESEENYVYLREQEITGYIKPSNYEQSKTRKYRNNIYKVENMLYDKEQDSYSCPQGKALNYVYSQEKKNVSGYISQKKVYRCESCTQCPHREKCYRGKKANRELVVAPKFQSEREACYERITSEKGIQLRSNRSIQVEGAFGVIKEDYHFRRFLTRGKRKTETQFYLVALAYNIQKLYNRRKSDRFQQELFEIKVA